MRSSLFPGLRRTVRGLALRLMKRDMPPRFSALLQATADLNALLDQGDVLYHTLLERLNQAVPFDSGSLQLMDGDTLYIAAFRGSGLDPDVVSGLRFPRDPLFPNYRVIEDAAPHAVADTHVEYPHFRTRRDEFSSGYIRSWLGVPLLVDGTVTGMFALDRTVVNPFTDSEIRIAQGFADHAAVAIRNARLYSELQEALRAKDALMRELHHRVKNNLQLITSLMAIHQDAISDPQAQRSMEELRLRINSIASVHERLYESAQVGTVDLSVYLREVAAEICGTYSTRSFQPDLQLDLEPLISDLRRAVPLGLIVSEAIINSVKHAFPGRTTGAIVVSLKRHRSDGVLYISDDGSGVGTSGPVQTGFGINLITVLAEQIQGQARLVPRDPGTTWEVTFPEESDNRDRS